MANSASPKDTLALGLAIVDELRLDTRGELLQRWMAHHLAETIQAAAAASGAKKATLEGEAVALILKLWLHRRALPEPVDPRSGCREAIQVLKLLQPQANPWARHPQRQPDLTLLGELFNAMSHAMLAAIALTQTKTLRLPTAAEAAHLDPSELALVETFAQWLHFVDRTPRPKVVVTEQDEPGGMKVSISVDPDPLEALSDDKNNAARLQALVAESLRTVHASLGRLIEQWDKDQKPTVHT